jgi:hypothetical protein
MEKLDLLKSLKELYTAKPGQIIFSEVPPLNYLSIDGKGDPNTSSFYKDAVQALFSLAYGIKFAIKKGEQSIDFKVMPLEGLWWVEDMRKFNIEHKDEWLWSMMILQPQLVTAQLVDETRASLLKKKGFPLLIKVQLVPLEEGKCAQTLHAGPYATEGPTVAALHAAIAEKGFQRMGKHHEIYLNTPLKTAPEKLRTIIRQPVGL